MQKYKNTIIFIAVALVVFLGTFLISKYGMPTNFKEISYSEYVDLKKEDSNYIYVGNDEEDTKALSSFAKNNDITIYHLNSDKLTDEQKKEVYGKDEVKSTLNLWKNDKKTYSYKDDFNSYKMVKSFMKNKLIDKDIITVTVAEYLDIIKGKEYNLMFIGSATCSYCDMFKPELRNVLSKYDVNIYYVDLSTVTQDDLSKLYATDKYFTEEQWGTPLTFLYKNNKRIDVLNGYVPADKVIEFFQKNNVID